MEIHVIILLTKNKTYTQPFQLQQKMVAAMIKISPHVNFLTSTGLAQRGISEIYNLSQTTGVPNSRPAGHM